MLLLLLMSSDNTSCLIHHRHKFMRFWPFFINTRRYRRNYAMPRSTLAGRPICPRHNTGMTPGGVPHLRLLWVSRSSRSDAPARRRNICCLHTVSGTVRVPTTFLAFRFWNVSGHRKYRKVYFSVILSFFLTLVKNHPVAYRRPYPHFFRMPTVRIAASLAHSIFARLTSRRTTLTTFTHTAPYSPASVPLHSHTLRPRIKNI